MGSISASPRSKGWGTLADILTSAKEKGNQYEVKDWVPLAGGEGLGSLIMGKAPELANDISYQGLGALVKGGNAATGGIGSYNLDPRVLDAAQVASLVTGPIAGAGKLTTSGAKKLVEGATEGTMNPMRRNFLKGSAAVAGTAALGGFGMAKKLLKEDVKDTARVASKDVSKAASKHKFDSLADYNTHLNDEAKKAYDEFGVHSGEDPDRWMATWKEELAQAHENNYIEAKRNINSAKPKKSIDTGQIPEHQSNTLNEFSPKAKAEMSDLKGRVAESNYFNKDNEHWSSALDNPDDYPHQGWWTESNVTSDTIPF